jgi:hypothetical protein
MRQGEIMKRKNDWSFYSVLNKVYQYPGGGIGSVADIANFNEMLFTNSWYADASIMMEYPLPFILPDKGIFSDKRKGSTSQKVFYFPTYTNNYNGYFQEIISDSMLSGVIELTIKDRFTGGANTGKHYKKIYSTLPGGPIYYYDDFGGDECTSSITSPVTTLCPGSSGGDCTVTCNSVDGKEHIAINLGTATDKIAIAYEIKAGVKNNTGTFEIYPKAGSTSTIDLSDFSLKSGLDREGTSQLFFDSLVFP